MVDTVRLKYYNDFENIMVQMGRASELLASTSYEEQASVQLWYHKNRALVDLTLKKEIQ